MSKKSILFGVILLATGYLNANTATAQYSFGVHWDPPQSNERSLQQLEHFHQLGITHLEIKKALPDTVWKSIEEYRFTVFGMLTIRYPVVNTFLQPDSTLLNTIRTGVDRFNRRTPVTALGLFEFGQASDKAFAEAVEVYLNQIRMVSSSALYYKSSLGQSSAVDSLFNFRMVEVRVGNDFGENNLQSLLLENKGITRAYSYRPRDQANTLLKPLKIILDRFSEAPNPLLFFDGSWLLQMHERYPSLNVIINSYANGENPVFPLPDESRPVDSSHSIAVILLLLIWTSVAIIYRSEPIYRRSLMRYFNAHKFFVSDVMGRHMRSNLPAVIILFQHMLAGGLWLYCLGQQVLSERGFEAFTHYFPYLQLTTGATGSLILLGILVTLLISLICILWLRLLIPSIKLFSQATTLYAWPLQVNLVLTTLMVLILISGSGTVLMLVTGLLWLLVFLGSYVLTAIETSGYLLERRVLVLLGTAGLYLVGIAGLLLWAGGNSFLQNIADLSLSLS